MRVRRRRTMSDDLFSTGWRPAQIVYGWLIPEEQALVRAAISFTDLLAAQRLLPVVDALARGVEIVRHADSTLPV